MMEIDRSMTGSWVAVPTPMREDYSIDFDGFRRLVDFHAAHDSAALLIGGSAGEVSTLSLEERKEIVAKIAPYAADKLPVFFSSSMPTTAQTVELSRYSEDEGAAGLVLTVPAYAIPPQAAVLEYLATATTSVSIPVGIYNNPSRVFVNIEPETIVELHRAAPNFMFDKEASSDASQLQRVHELTEGNVAIFSCDNPRYGLLPSVLTFGNGAANITANIDPDGMAAISQPFGAGQDLDEWRANFLAMQPLIRACYSLMNPMAIKAALAMVGRSCGPTRPPLLPVTGPKVEELRSLMEHYRIAERYPSSERVLATS